MSPIMWLDIANSFSLNERIFVSDSGIYMSCHFTKNKKEITSRRKYYYSC